MLFFIAVVFYMSYFALVMKILMKESIEGSVLREVVGILLLFVPQVTMVLLCADILRVI